MIDDLLKLGSTFDWISPLVAFVQDWRNGPSDGFSVPLASGWSTREVRSLLTGYGIKVWGMMLVADSLIFSVRRTQAGFAEFLLTRAGVPYRTSYRGRKATTPGRPSPTPITHRRDWLAASLDVIDRLSG